MQLTKEEMEVCKKYRQRDKDGFVHCRECPLVIHELHAVCKRTIDKKDYKELGLNVSV